METQTLPTYRRVARRKSRVKTNYEETFRACEAAAAQIKSAGEELATCWMALGQNLAANASATDLLRKRAWCNVLELRLREQSHALEEARRNLDAVWEEMVSTVQTRETFRGFLNQTTTALAGGA